MSRTASGKEYRASIPSAARLVQHIRIPLFRNAYALSLSSGTSALLGLVYWVIAARYYPTDIVGLNSAAIAAAGLLAGLANLYLDGSFLRFLPRAGAAARPFVLIAYGLATTVAGVITVLFLLNLTVLSPALSFLNATPWVSGGFIFVTMLSCIFVLEDGVLTGLRQAVWVPLENITYSVAKILLLIFFAHALPTYGILASWTLPAIILIIPVNWLILKRLIPNHIKNSTQVEPVKPLMVARYSGANYLAYLFNVTTMRVLPLMVIEVAGNQASAYFYLPFAIVTSLQMLNVSTGLSLVVEGTLDRAKLLSFIRQALVHMFRLQAPVVLAIVAGAPIALSIFGKGYAAEGSALLRLLALGLLPNIFLTLYISLSRVRQQIGRIILVQAFLAVLVLGLSLALLPAYGITGVGVAWLAAQTLIAIVLFFSELRSVLWG